MFIIDTYLNTSKIHGIGVFSNQFVKKGEVIWIFNSKIDLLIKNSDINNFNSFQEIWFKKYAYFNKEVNKWLLCGDNARFTNHSLNPNTKVVNINTVIAIKDIDINEELTENYNLSALNIDNSLI